MRILVVSQYFWPEHFRISDLVAALVERGHEVRVLTGRPNYPVGQVFPEYAAAPEAFTHYRGADVTRVANAPRGSGRFRLAWNYLSFVLHGATLGVWRTRDFRPDVIFVFQTSPVTSCLPAILIGRLRQRPVVMWTLDLWPETLAAVGVLKNARLLSLVGVLVSFIYRQCALVLGQSRAFESSIKRYGGPVAFGYFPQWVEPDLTEGAGAIQVAAELTEPSRRFTVLFAGNIGEAQDFPSVVEAAVLLKDRQDIRFVIVGTGRAEEQLRAAVAERGLQESVQLLGRFPHERMPSFFAGADALLVSLRADPAFDPVIPGKVQSYLAAGRPIIGMLNGEGAKVIVDSRAGLCAPAGDAQTLAAHIRTLAATSPSELAEMGTRGAAYAREHFDREQLVTKLERWLVDATAKA